AASEIDRATLRRIEEARTAFLDLDEGGKVARPVVEGRALDLAPSRSVRKASEATRIMEL
ncbi:MAG: hypothetical protein AB7P16_30455, partial [Bradyrhizobium sp.]|uniref:hypothetical protein n=1 Tax=Bradyrhizobium sp. TaxID=376 RepID=UPI003D108C4A